MQVFLAVQEAGSLGHAAGVLGLSQPTLSRRLADLESTLGQAVFERSTRGLNLTRFGRTLLPPALHMREQVLGVHRATQRHSRQVAGSVRITASEMVSAHLLMPVLAQLHKEHPDIQIDLVASDNVEDLLGRDADIALRMFRPEEPSLTVRRLADAPWACLRTEMTWPRTGCPPPTPPVWRGITGLARTDARQCVPAVVPVLQEISVPPLSMWLAVHRELRGTPRLRVVFDALGTALGR